MASYTPPVARCAFRTDFVVTAIGRAWLQALQSIEGDRFVVLCACIYDWEYPMVERHKMI